MEINCGNEVLVLHIKLKLFRKPREKKLKKELSNFFDENEIEGIKIKNFYVDISKRVNSYIRIIYPLIGDKKFVDICSGPRGALEEIGGRHNLNSLRFSSDCFEIK